MSAFMAIFRRDLALSFRQGSAVTLSVMFFALAVTLFPLGVGPEPQILARVGAGVLWVAALLSAMLSLDRLFQADYEDGSLDLIALGPLPLELTALANIAAHWVASGLPLVVISPVLALALDLPLNVMPAVVAAMLLGTPSLSLIGAIGAALTVGVRRGGVLLSLIVLPLYVPVLIFGVAAIDAAAGGAAFRAPLLILGALLALGLALGPIASAAALRLALE